MSQLSATMGGHLASLVVALKAVTLVLGGMVTYLAYRASIRTELDSLRFLAIGFGLVTLGSLLAGVVDQVLGLQTDLAILVESFLVVGGLAVILYSLYSK